MADNFEAVDLSWVKSATDPLKVLGHGVEFLEDPSKINSDNCEMWCNLHYSCPQGHHSGGVQLGGGHLLGQKGHLGSDSDPTEPGVANLIVAFGISPWPHTLSLARVHVAPNQKMCSITQAIESAREHFSGENGLDMPHYYLTPVHTEALYILSDAGLQATDGSAMVIGVATVGINLKDNTVNLATSEGPTSTLVIHHLLHLKTNLVLVLPQLSYPTWTGMRRAGIWFESFIHFTALYAPPNRSESEINAHQLGLMGASTYPSQQYCWLWPTSWTISGQHHPSPRRLTLES